MNMAQAKFYIRLFRIYIGIGIFLGTLCVIVWNEYRSLRIDNSLEFIKNKVIPVPSSPINLANNGKLVHFTGMTTSEKLTDPIFDVNVNAVTLVRTVNMYQNTEKGTYGTEQWADHVIDFTDNKNKPSWLFHSKAWQVKEIKVGDYFLPDELVAKIPSKAVLITKARIDQLQAIYHIPLSVYDNDALYAGKDPDNPAVGDMKINLTVILPQQVSIMAEQQGPHLKPFPTPNGEDVFLLFPGQLSASEVLSKAQDDNILYAWLWRLGSIVALFQGLRILRSPLDFLAKHIPIFARLMTFNVTIAAFVLAFIIATITITTSWIAFRWLFPGILI